MIKLEQISLQRGSKFLLEQASAVFYPGQKIALIGGNGSGKSSLFALLLGTLQADSGDIRGLACRSDPLHVLSPSTRARGVRPAYRTFIAG